METLAAKLTENDYSTDRYPRYEWFRENDPITWDQESNSWLVFKYKDIAALARSKNVCTNQLVEEKLSALRHENPYLNNIYNTITKWMIYNEGTDHTRLRKLSNTIFTKENIESFRAMIRSAVNAELDKCVDNDVVDFVRDFAHTVPAIFLRDVIGLNEIDIKIFIQWSDSIADFMQDFVVSPTPDLSVAKQASDHMEAMKSSFRDAIALRRRTPKHDILTSLIIKNDEIMSMTEDEFVCQLIHLIFGGHKIPEFIVANAINCALSNDIQFEKFSDGEFVDQFVEEAMRVESPIQFITRHATEDFEFEGVTFKKGDSIYLMLGSANRDETIFEDHDQFKLGRSGRRGLYYGTGAHACIGAALAGMELREIFSGLSDRIKSVKPLYDIHRPEWSTNATFHGIVSMPLQVTWK